jgi:hypothetical protein
MKHYLIVICLLSVLSSQAQEVQTWSPDSLEQSDPNYAMNRYHDILHFHDPYMYLAYPIINPIVKRKVPLRDGEGKGGYWGEGNIAYRFSVYQGSYFHTPFFQRMRLTFDVGITLRLTDDYSSPLLPSNDKFGFGLDYLLSPIPNLRKENTALVWTTVQVHHYSNGQADSFFIEGHKRNNYHNGDFSNDYWRAMLNIAGASKQKSIISTSVGYQKDFDPGGPLSRSPELDKYYGDSRVLFNFQWTQKPLLKIVNYANKSTAEPDSVAIKKRRHFAFRTELEYILGDLSNFPGKDKHRFGAHGYLTYMPSVTNEVGFMAHAYTGRDYLNIRFDDIVFIGELGLYVMFGGKR